MYLFEEGSKEDQLSISLATRTGVWINNQVRDERAPEAMQAGLAICQKYTRNIRLRSLSGWSYNCVGMVFGARRTWIDADMIDLILKQDGYDPVSEPANVVPGDIVVYYYNRIPAHVGIILSTEAGIIGSQTKRIIVLSKFGDGPEFFHEIDDVMPMFWNGEDCRAFSERGR